MKTQKILIIEDEEKIVKIVQAYLEREGYSVLTAFNGKDGMSMAIDEKPDLIILDLMLPEISGWDICRTLRRDSSVPIIMLTARGEDTDKIIGLELGADDYITKPFNPKELVSRVRAVLRRVNNKVGEPAVIVADDLSIDSSKHLVSRNNTVIELTPIEFELLELMARNPGRVYSRLQILDRVQGDSYDGYDRTVDSHIKNLRKKIEIDAEHPRYIITVHGIGYKFRENA